MIYYIKSYKGSNAYYAKSTLIATSMWKSTDAWRGYSEIVPEPDFKKNRRRCSNRRLGRCTIGDIFKRSLE